MLQHLEFDFSIPYRLVPAFLAVEVLKSPPSVVFDKLLTKLRASFPASLSLLLLFSFCFLTAFPKCG